MTSALFTDGINHSLAELEIPTEFILSSLFDGSIAQPHAPHPASFLVGCWEAGKILSDSVYFLGKRNVNTGVNLGRDPLHILDLKVWQHSSGWESSTLILHV